MFDNSVRATKGTYKSEAKSEILSSKHQNNATY